MKRFALMIFLIWGIIMRAQIMFAEVSKEQLFSTPSFISAKISPNGKYIAKVGSDASGIANVSIFPVEKKACDAQKLSSFDTPEIIQFFWSPDSQKVLILKDENGTGKLNLHGFDIQSKKHFSYTKQFPRVNTKLVQFSSSKNKAVVGLNHRNPRFHDLYVLDIDSGELTLLFENNEYVKFLVSEDLELVLKMKINSDGSWTVFTKDDQIFLKLTSEEAFQTEFISYNTQEQVVYFLDNRYSNTNQLTKKSIVNLNQEHVLGGQTFSDVDEVLFIKGKPRAYASYYTQKQWHVLDPAVQKDLNFLAKHVGENFELISQSQDGNVWIVSNSHPDKGVYFWVYQKKASSLQLLAPALDEQRKPFAKMYEMIVAARDGEKLVCYYTLPKEYDQGGFVETPLPLVVVPHGGPFKVRDKFEFNPFHQWLASCGYAVLSVNFRLSSGFGKEFVNAGNGEWGGKAHLDIIDATDACIAKGLTKKGQLAIFGGSYGGYEALAALTFTPKYFTCSVAICGPSNLRTVLEGVPEFWELTAKPLSDDTKFFTKQAFITSMGGDPKEPKGVDYLEKCSPLHFLNHIQAPLLLVHGKNDHIVAESESKQIYESMKKNNKPVKYILFENEGHRFGNFANKMMYLDQAERFLSQHLHGKYQPLKEELVANTTGTIFP